MTETLARAVAEGYTIDRDFVASYMRAAYGRGYSDAIPLRADAPEGFIAFVRNEAARLRLALP